MRRTTRLAAPALLTLGALAACEPTGAITKDITPTSPIAAAGPVEAAVKANNGFGLALYQQLKGKAGNLAFSPASISLALAMTYAGARGETATEMEKTLQAGPDAKAFHSAWATQLNGWQSPTGADIAVANRLFGDKRYAFEAPYLSLTKAHYGAPLQPVDFAGAPQQQRLIINAWVAEQTRDRIKDLIPPPGVTGATRMALVNAIYFKAKWNAPFPKAGTKDDTFTTAAGTKVTTPMMTHTTAAHYGEVDGVQLMALGYRGGRFATLFVLPPANQKLADVESKLDRGLLDQWTGALQREQVWIRLPKFTIKPGAAVALKAPLQAMGMKRAFASGGADFTGITNPSNPSDRLFITQVYHKAFVAMDEAGTEAAAATAVVAGRESAAPREPKQFRADRPFLFFIRDIKTNLVMFAGRLVDPTQ